MSAADDTRHDEPGQEPPGLCGVQAELSVTTRRVLIEVWRRDDAGGAFPTVRELCDAVGLRSTATVHRHLQRLEREGLVELHRGWGRPRTPSER